MHRCDDRQTGRQADRQALLICLVSSHYRQVRELPESKIEPVSPGKRPEGAVPSCSIYDTTTSTTGQTSKQFLGVTAAATAAVSAQRGKNPSPCLPCPPPAHLITIIVCQQGKQTNRQAAAHRVHTIKRAPATATDTDTQRLKAKKGKGKRNPTNNKIMKRKKQRVHTGNLCDTPLLQSPLSQLASPSI